MARRSNISRRKPAKPKKLNRRSRRWGFKIAMLLAACLVGYVVYLDVTVRQQFEGKRWALPARVHARPLELFIGKSLTIYQFEQELKGLQYHFVRDPRYPGEVARNGNSFVVTTRSFRFWDGAQASQELRVNLGNGKVNALYDIASGNSLELVRLDPELIGILYPSHNEDRILVRANEVPGRLLEMLIAVEDHGFYSHVGLSPTSIIRALFANLKAQRFVQGGSTLTQQLVKNFFLSNERTIARKANEAIMALLVEFHYSKQQIIETYLNEVYLGQDGKRAIHGFGLASQYYFERGIEDLSIDQMALLVALVKGASYYDPRRNPERAKNRRNLVLKVAAERGILSRREVQRARGESLGVAGARPASANRYPAFLELVRRQLRSDYRDEDLTSEGLQIFTTLDPWVQSSFEKAFAQQLSAIELRRGVEAGTLQGAGVAISTGSAEVLALVGGRETRYTGFNRALDAQRPIGSIIKPAVYVTALKDPEQYTLATILDDEPLTVSTKYGKDWEPQNYDRKFHGPTLLVQALAHSYNVPSVRLGMTVGLNQVIDTLKDLGIEKKIEPYPSLLLGAIELSPLEVAQFYQTLASGGFRSPLRSIRAVLTVDGKPLQRYPITVQQVLDPEPVYLLNHGLQQVVRSGTARGLVEFLPRSLNVAGKTGTTDELRDSWFAGFTGNQLAVVWLGRDDNKSMGLTGSSGAMRVWGKFMEQVGTEPLQLTPSNAIAYEWIDGSTGARSVARCKGAIQLPFIIGSAPENPAKCTGAGRGGGLHWFRN